MPSGNESSVWRWTASRRGADCRAYGMAVKFEGTDSIEDAVREVVRVARLGPNGPTGTFTTWEGVDVPW
jgi:hypothetical protein